MKDKKQHTGAIYGGVAGLVLIAFTTVLYLGGVDLYLGRVAYLGYILMIGLAVLATLMEKRANDGLLDFQAALKTAFTVMALALAAQTLFTWVLLNFIDTHFKVVLALAVLERNVTMLKEMGITGEQLNRTMADARGKDQFTLGSMSLGFAISCIAHFLIALLIAAIVKKKRTEIPEAAFQ